MESLSAHRIMHLIIGSHFVSFLVTAGAKCASRGEVCVSGTLQQNNPGNLCDNPINLL